MCPVPYIDQIMLSYADSKKCNWNFMYTPKLIYVPNLSKFIKCLVLNYMPSFNLVVEVYLDFCQAAKFKICARIHLMQKVNKQLF